MALGRCPTILLISAAALAAAPATAADDNLYDWMAVAPVVIAAESLGENGKYTEMRVEEVLRGPEPSQPVVRVNVTKANRDRNRDHQPKGIHLDEGHSFVVLLTPAGTKKGWPVYELVRGIRGARELPAEGREAHMDAVRRFLEIQDLKQDPLIWSGMRELLEGRNPLMIETSLDQHLKFRRGDGELVITLRPLMDHPDPDLRQRAARLAGQIASRVGRDQVPEVEALWDELIAMARRDPLPQVRAAATEALNHVDGPGALKVLEEIADHDPDQVVRFVAERYLFERKME